MRPRFCPWHESHVRFHPHDGIQTSDLDVIGLSEKQQIPERRFHETTRECRAEGS